MIVSRYLVYCSWLGLTFFAPSVCLAEKLTEIPSKKFHLAKQTISLLPISETEATEISVNKNIALINSGRNIWIAKATSRNLEIKKPVFALDSTWYGPTCPFSDGFVVSVKDYPEGQRDSEANTSRGGFVAGPEAKGFYIISPSAPDRYLKSIAVNAKPHLPPADAYHNAKTKEFIDHVESCAWDGKKMVIGSYGSLGKADFASGTIDIIEEDEDLSLNRLPVLIDGKDIWVGVDEGGLGGANLVLIRSSGKRKTFWIDHDEEYTVVSVTALLLHRGKLIVGTSRGLFSLNKKSGHFSRFDIGAQLTDLPVTGLTNHQGYLWVFIGGEWLRIDVKKEQAIRYMDSLATKFMTGKPFGKGWLLSAPTGVWSYSDRRIRKNHLGKHTKTKTFSHNHQKSRQGV